MPRCLHRERGLDFQHVVALGASPDYFQLGDMRVMNVSRVDNKTWTTRQAGSQLSAMSLSMAS